MRPQDYQRFERTVAALEQRAHEFGLDFFDMRYELCPPDVVYRIAGAGMPTRFNHWSFGKHYYRQKLDYDFGLSRIYELVINSNPCYAFLLENNTVLQNEMVVAHVLGHSDFFKHNSRFAHTNRNMVETMAETAARLQRYEEVYGIEEVEPVMDAVLAISEHVDASRRTAQMRGKQHFEHEQLSSEPETDLLYFLAQNSRHLKEWERDILASLREESLYFWPQYETKIMNEGWATYWHTLLMQDLHLEPDDAIEFAKLTAGVSQPNRFHLNPYNVGLAIWRGIEQKYGREEMFIARETDSDVSFLRNYLTQDIVDECDLYLYERKGDDWVIVEKDFRVIRNTLITQRVHGGFPVIHVTSGDHAGAGELYLEHQYEGVELDAGYVEKTLPYVHRLWGKRVTLLTWLDNREIEYTYDGNKVIRIFR